jgi:hypothetical protein
MCPLRQKRCPTQPRSRSSQSKGWLRPRFEPEFGFAPCNQKKDSKFMEVFWSNGPVRLERIKRQRKQPWPMQPPSNYATGALFDALVATVVPLCGSERSSTCRWSPAQCKAFHPNIAVNGFGYRLIAQTREEDENTGRATRAVELAIPLQPDRQGVS